MGKKREEGYVHRNCYNVAFRLLYKYEAPTDEQIYKAMCLTNNCPEEHCTFKEGFTHGRECGHVDKVRSIIHNLLLFRDEN
jgi:hypothetical protein